MDSHRFIEKDFQVCFPEQTKLTIHGCKFNQKLYTPAQFAALNIKKPQDIEKMVIKRQAEYLAGRYCAEQALNGLHIEGFEINKDQYRCPIWPPGIKGSISHTSTLALAVTSNKDHISGVGVDIEPIVNSDKVESLKKQVLHRPVELELFNQHSDPAFMFTLFFSLKESFFKAAYPQVKRIFNFDAVEIVSHNQEEQYCIFRLCKTLSPGINEGQQFKGYYQLLDSNLMTLCVL